MKLVLYPRGIPPNEFKYLSVFVCFVPGDHDDDLSWPFRQEIKLILRNPKTHEQYERTTCFHKLDNENEAGRKPDESKEGRGYGVDDFISLGDLFRFVDDNTIIIAARVQNYHED